MEYMFYTFTVMSGNPKQIQNSLTGDRFSYSFPIVNHLWFCQHWQVFQK